MKIRKYSIPAALAAALIISLAPAAALFWDSAQEKKLPRQIGGVLNLEFSMPFTSLDPYESLYGSSNDIIPFIYSFLVIPKPGGGFIPDLAADWRSDKDELNWDFYIRSNARFHDGRPVTADDVAYSLEKLFEYNVVLRGALDIIQVLSPHHIKIRFKRRTPFFLYQLAVEGAVVPRPAQGNKNSDKKYIGSGPFQVEKQFLDKSILLKPFTDYYGKRPLLEAVTINYQPDKEKTWAGFMHEEVQFFHTVSPENFHLMQLEPNYIRLEGKYDKGASLLLFNVRNELFSDKRVRKLLAGLLDIRGHIEKDLRGQAAVCPGPLGMFSPYNPPEAGDRPDDWKRAGAILEELGWTDEDGDAYLEKNGREFEFTILFPKTFQMEAETALYIQRVFNQFGIKAHIREKRFDQIVEENLIPGNFDACLTENNTNPRLLHILIALWSARERGFANYGGYSNKKLEQVFDQIMTMDKDADYAEPLRRVHELLTEDQPAIWLYHSRQVNAFSKRLVGITSPDQNHFITYPLLWTRF